MPSLRSRPRSTISYLWRPMLRDPDDELVLETAVNGNADLLLTFNERDFAGAWSLRPLISRPGPALRGGWRDRGDQVELCAEAAGLPQA